MSPADELILKGTSKNSKISFSLREKVGMRGLKSIIYTPHPSPLPVGESIFRGSLKLGAESKSDTIDFFAIDS
jgi:hypothetical protein